MSLELAQNKVEALINAPRSQVTGSSRRGPHRMCTSDLRDNPDIFLLDGILKVEILNEQKDLVATIDIAIVRPGGASPA